MLYAKRIKIHAFKMTDIKCKSAFGKIWRNKKKNSNHHESDFELYIN